MILLENMPNRNVSAISNDLCLKYRPRRFPLNEARPRTNKGRYKNVQTMVFLRAHPLRLRRANVRHENVFLHVGNILTTK